VQGFDQPIIDAVQRRLIVIEFFCRFVNQIKAKQWMFRAKIARYRRPPRQ